MTWRFYRPHAEAPCEDDIRQVYQTAPDAKVERFRQTMAVWTGKCEPPDDPFEEERAGEARQKAYSEKIAAMRAKAEKEEAERQEERAASARRWAEDAAASRVTQAERNKEAKKQRHFDLAKQSQALGKLAVELYKLSKLDIAAGIYVRKKTIATRILDLSDDVHESALYFQLEILRENLDKELAETPFETPSSDK
jgi:lysyl-tRNA synthetase class I